MNVIYSYRSALPALLHNLQPYTLPTLNYLAVWCEDERIVRYLTDFLPQCTNLHTFLYQCVFGDVVSDRDEEEMWNVALRRCENLEELRLEGDYCDRSRDILKNVIKKLTETEGIQKLKLRSIVRVNWGTDEVITDYTEQFQHLLPALHHPRYHLYRHLWQRSCCLIL